MLISSRSPSPPAFVEVISVKTLVSNTLKECIIILPVQVWKLREKQFIQQTAQDDGNEDPEPETPDSECCV